MLALRRTRVRSAPSQSHPLPSTSISTPTQDETHIASVLYTALFVSPPSSHICVRCSRSFSSSTSSTNVPPVPSPASFSTASAQQATSTSTSTSTSTTTRVPIPIKYPYTFNLNRSNLAEQYAKRNQIPIPSQQTLENAMIPDEIISHQQSQSQPTQPSPSSRSSPSVSPLPRLNPFANALPFSPPFSSASAGTSIPPFASHVPRPTSTSTSPSSYLTTKTTLFPTGIGLKPNNIHNPNPNPNSHAPSPSPSASTSASASLNTISNNLRPSQPHAQPFFSPSASVPSLGFSPLATNAKSFPSLYPSQSQSQPHQQAQFLSFNEARVASQIFASKQGLPKSIPALQPNPTIISNNNTNIPTHQPSATTSTHTATATATATSAPTFTGSTSTTATAAAPTPFPVNPAGTAKLLDLLRATFQQQQQQQQRQQQQEQQQQQKPSLQLSSRTSPGLGPSDPALNNLRDEFIKKISHLSLNVPLSKDDSASAAAKKVMEVLKNSQARFNPLAYNKHVNSRHGPARSPSTRFNPLSERVNMYEFNATASPSTQPAQQPIRADGSSLVYSTAGSSSRGNADRRKLRHMEKAINAKRIHITRRQTLKYLSNAMGIKSIDLMRTLRMIDTNTRTRTINDSVNMEMAELLVTEFGFEVEKEQSVDVLFGETTHDRFSLPPRAPVVCVMGHVDHGKTTLLDALRKSTIAAGEAGGITQSIGAFPVVMSYGGIDAERPNTATFLDTPGHAAFKSMRQRGANNHCTDIVVLVVSAVDGVQPQTLEAIELAQSNNIPIVVAINKCDIDGANPQQVRQHLQTYDVVAEELGGDILTVEISAKNGDGLDRLQEAIGLTADLLDLRAANQGNAEAFIIESRAESGTGVILNVMVRSGCLHVGDWVVSGTEVTRVRALLDYTGLHVEEATPSTAVQLLGFKDIGAIGDDVICCDSEEMAKQVVTKRREEADAEKMTAVENALPIDVAKEAVYKRKVAGRSRMVVDIKPLTQEEKQEQEAAENAILSIVVKTDTNGAMKALEDYLTNLPNDQVQVVITRAAIGPITLADIQHAKLTNSMIIGFGVDAATDVMLRAKADFVTIKYSPIIYRIMDEIKTALGAKLPVTTVTDVTGLAEVAAVFPINLKRRQTRHVAGFKCLSGEIAVGAKYRITRDDVVICESVTVSSLKHLKEEVTEVAKGGEGGIMFEGWDDIQAGDRLEAITVRTIPGVFDDSAARGNEPRKQSSVYNPNASIIKRKNIVGASSQ